MTPPRPEDLPDATKEDRIDLLADAPAPTRREVPVRPKELDLPRSPERPEGGSSELGSSEPGSAASGGPTPVRPAPRAGEWVPEKAPEKTADKTGRKTAGITTEAAADGPVPCPRCKYDLRGRPGGTRCPECGTLVQGRARIALRPGERRTARDGLFDAWQRFAGSSLVSVLVVSPLVYFLPVGVAIASCTGFGPAFRLFALRDLGLLPGPLREPFAGQLALWRWLERAQIALAVLITIGGLLSTVGVVGPRAVPLYYLALTLWWTLAVTAIAVQIRVGDRLSQLIVDPSVLPLEVVPKIMRWLQATAIAGVAGGALAVYAAFRFRAGGSLPYADTVAAASRLILLGAMFGQIVVSIHARAHAVLVANCFFESEYFRANPNLLRRRDADDAGGVDDIPTAVPPAKRHSFTPKGDDSPLPLPGDPPRD